ncbi:MAG TPA: helix-turn-helix transcriptional regulator [Myxococcaceae bacterium]|nr:helix-turn-helix transcriptional regulator [Myxococcaceae bacterium]
MEVVEARPVPSLRPWVRSFAVVESREEATRELIPEPGFVLGFRYRGGAAEVEGSRVVPLPPLSATGFRTRSRRIRTLAGSGAVFVRLTELGAAQLLDAPLRELHGRTLALEEVLPGARLVAEQVAESISTSGRLATLERFLLGRLRPSPVDARVAAAVAALRQHRGGIRIDALAAAVGLGQDALEKRFRAVVGATPKQLASLLRLRSVLRGLAPGRTLSQLAIEAGYADQSHFIRAFRAMTGQAPRSFLESTAFC